MLDYIGGEIVCVTGTCSESLVTLQVQGKDRESIEQQFHVRGWPPGQLGQRLVVMVLAGEVVGWHNQATGAQGNLLHSMSCLCWQRLDVLIAIAGVLIGWFVSVPLGLAGGIGWCLSTVFWRMHVMRRARGELLEALRLSSGVVGLRKKSQARANQLVGEKEDA